MNSQDVLDIGPHCWLGDVELLRDAREVRRDGHTLHVEPKVFDLIRVLAERHHRVVTREELLEHVWRGDAVCTAAISQCVYQARRVLGDLAVQSRFIKTVQRRGYRFIASVVVEEPDDSAAFASDQASGLVRRRLH
ncbi:MAG: winged helix-turn-helix domain-containing protein [Deltaproteobacteria bacterium]|nr:winged helix-turn-helix domain-containing protein [Deltaproteobacteria bacterium]